MHQNRMFDFQNFSWGDTQDPRKFLPASNKKLSPYSKRARLDRAACGSNSALPVVESAYL